MTTGLALRPLGQRLQHQQEAPSAWQGWRGQLPRPARTEALCGGTLRLIGEPAATHLRPRRPPSVSRLSRTFFLSRVIDLLLCGQGEVVKRESKGARSKVEDKNGRSSTTERLNYKSYQGVNSTYASNEAVISAVRSSVYCVRKVRPKF